MFYQEIVHAPGAKDFDQNPIDCSALADRHFCLRDRSLARDIAGINTRITELSDEMKTGFLQLSDKIVRDRLHAEADYQDILRRMRELESKAS